MQYANQYPSNQMIRNNYATPAPQNNNFIMSNNNFLKGKPVASIEEARATSIDFDGSIFFFPDLANKRIYTKQINMDGTATMQCYELIQLPVEQGVNPSNFITRDEFNNALQELKKSLVPQEKKKEAISYDF